MPVTKRVLPNTAQPKTINLAIEDTIGWDYMDLDDYLRVAIYGNTATGKTSLASTFPGKILWLVCSGGDKPGELKTIRTEKLMAKIDPKVIKSSEDAFRVIDYAKSSGKYSTIVIDHITGVQSLMVMEVLKLKEAPLAYGRSHAQENRGMTLVSEQEWGFIGIECQKLLRPILSMDCNVVIIGHQREFRPKKKEDSDGSSDLAMTSIGIAVIPGLAGWIYGATDFNLQTFIRPKMIESVVESKTKGAPPIVTTVRDPAKKFQYCCRTGPHDLFTSKFRLSVEFADRLPECIVNPSYDKIVALTKGEEVGDE